MILWDGLIAIIEVEKDENNVVSQHFGQILAEKWWFGGGRSQKMGLKSSYTTENGQCLALVAIVYMWGGMVNRWFVVFGQRCHYIRTHGQVKANLLHSPQLLLCFSLYVQRIQPPHLVAIQSSLGLVHIHSRHRYRFFDHWGTICRKILTFVILKVFKIWHGIIPLWRCLWYGALSAEKPQFGHPRTYVIWKYSNLMRGGDGHYLLLIRQMINEWGWSKTASELVGEKHIAINR